jgi:SP family general alpha glucoside:H+ symporter-like MFS transporter
MSAILFIIGFLGTRGNVMAVGYTQSALCLVWTFIFQLSIGQLGWAIPAEVGSTRLRQKTICLARNAYYIADVVGGVLQPYFMNPTEWNLKGYTSFIWGPTCFILAVVSTVISL